MSDELRDRIAEAIVREDTPQQIAQAIIDDLGLTVKAHECVTACGSSCLGKGESRVVGSWEDKR